MCSPGLADGISGHHARRTSLRGHCHYFAMATSPLPDLDSELSRARVALHGILGCRRPPLGFWRNLGNREGRLDSVVALTGRKTEHRPLLAHSHQSRHRNLELKDPSSPLTPPAAEAAGALAACAYACAVVCAGACPCACACKAHIQRNHIGVTQELVHPKKGRDVLRNFDQ